MRPRLSPAGGRPLPQGRLRPDLLFVDVESTGLHAASVPVEIGLCDDALAARSWLVRPPPGWLGLPRDPAAEALHGVGPDLLASEGIGVAACADLLDGIVGGRALVSDNPDHDAAWLDRLFEAAGRTRGFAVVGVADALLADVLGDPRAVAERMAAWEAGEAAAATLFGHVHRAGEDARSLAAAWRASLDPSYLLALLTCPA